jgi:nucleoside-diphosphate-sugar epimerase
VNVATGRATTVHELADTIGSILGQPVERDLYPARTGDIRDSYADVTRAAHLLGWEARVGLEDGLRIAAESFLERTLA